MMKRKISVKTAVMTPFVAVFLAMFILMSLILSLNYNWFSREQGSRIISTLADSTEQKIRSRLHDPLTVNQLFASTIAQQKLFDAPDDRLVAAFTQQVMRIVRTDFSQISAISFGDEKGRYIGFRVNADGSLSLMLQDARTDNKLMIFDGETTSSGVLATYEGYDPRTRPWYAPARATGEAQWSEIYINYDEKMAATMSHSIPVKDAFGVMVGVAEIDVSLDGLNTLLRDQQKDTQGALFIIDPQGRLVAHSDPSPVILPKVTRPPEGARIAAEDSPDALVQQTVRYIGESLRRGPDAFVFNLNGQNVLGIQRPLDIPEHGGWKLVISIPETSYIKGIQGKLNVSFLFVTLAILAGLAAGYLVMRAVSRPIIQSAEAAKHFRLDQADDAQQMEDSSLHETSELVEAFQVMRLRLRRAYEEADQSRSKVEEQNDMLLRHQAELRHSETVYRLLVENAQDMIFSMDIQQNFLAVNSAVERFSGLPREVLLGKSLRILAPQPEVEAKWQRHFRQVLESGKSQIFHLNYQTGDGQERHLRTLLMPVMTQDGQIASVTGTSMDVTDMISHEGTIRKIAYYDNVTGLPNRAHYIEHFDRMIREGDSSGRKLVSYCIDLDNFKKINDAQGHEEGDAILMVMARRLEGITRPGDLLARMGGDEFALLSSVLVTQADIEAVARQILREVEQPCQVGNMTHHLSASIGVAVYPDHGRDYVEILKKADTAMYKVKAMGRKNFQMFNQAIQEEAEMKLQLENHLRSALGNGEVEAWFQPLVDAGTGAVRGFEALMRWKSPVLGNVSPARFIPVLEETGLIVPYGTWMLEESCRRNRSWQKQFGIRTMVYVNISVVQFQTEGFVDTVRQVLKDTGLAPEALELEITESILIEEFDTVLASLKQLHDMGVRVALDDFGTGFSSLNYLTQLPIHSLKIDKSFVGDLMRNERKKAVLHSIVDMAHKLQLEVVAEGVETEEERQAMVRSACDILQGYYFHRPMPVRDIEALMTRIQTAQGEESQAER